VISLQGGEPQRISRIDKRGLDFEAPRWSPDGEKIAFLSMSSSESAEKYEAAEIWVCEFPGGEPRSITQKMKMSLTSPYDKSLSWSPDGKTIVFTKMEQRNPLHPQIYRIPCEGGEAAALNIEGFFPDISPDGKKITYVKPQKGLVGYWLVENFLPGKNSVLGVRR